MLKQLRLFPYKRRYRRFIPIFKDDAVTILQSGNIYHIKCSKTRREVKEEKINELLKYSKDESGDINSHALDINALEIGFLGKNFGMRA
jgi:hypothetical protein